MALRVPATDKEELADWNLTTVAGSIVKVTPLATTTSETIYGLSAAVQVVFVEIVPET